MQLRDDLLARRPGLHGERHVVLRAAGSLAVPVVRARRDHAAHEQQEDDQQGEERTSPGAAARIVMPVRPARLFLLHELAGYPARRAEDLSSSARRVQPGLEDDGRRRPVDHLPPLPAGRRPRPATRARPPRWRDVRPAARPGRPGSSGARPANALGLDGGRSAFAAHRERETDDDRASPRAPPPARPRPSGPREPRCGSCRAAPPSAGRRRRSRPRSARRPGRDRARDRAD